MPSVLGTAVSLALALPSTGLASENEREVIKLCERKIQQIYRVGDFRHVGTDKVGNHKYKVHGKVKYEGHKHGFDCKVKNGRVKSYNYDGPHPGLKDDDDVSLGTALAVGAGLAIVAAVASQANDDGKDGELNVRQSVLEDECHDALSYRLRDERHFSANVHLKSSKLEGRTMTGEAKVRYGHERPHKMEYTCHFDHNGRVADSRYHLY